MACVDSAAWPSESRLRARLPFFRRRARRVGLHVWALVGCAFALGVALTAAASVGVWRSTAQQGDQARAAKAATAQRLQLTSARADALEAKLRGAEAELARARQQTRGEQTALAHANAALGTATKSLHAVAASAQALRTYAPLLAQQTSTLTSDLDALQQYFARTPRSAIDPGFVQTQLRYIANAGGRLATTTASLRQAASAVGLTR